jgi:hypothetical protein
MACSRALEKAIQAISELSSLPRSSVECAVMYLGQCASKQTLGFLVDPRGASAELVSLGLPRFARLGQPIRLNLSLSPRYSCPDPAEVKITAASLVLHVHIASLLVQQEAVRHLVPTVVLAPGSDCVTILIDIPDDAAPDAAVVIESISVAGQRVTAPDLPAHLKVVVGMYAPLLLEQAMPPFLSQPVFASDGTFYVPQFGFPDVLVFSAKGTRLPPLPVSSVELSENTRVAAFDDETATLLLAEKYQHATGNKLVAVSYKCSTVAAVRWTVLTGDGCDGLSVLPGQGVVALSEMWKNSICIRRVADGASVCRAQATDPTYIASHCERGHATIYVSVGCSVASFRFTGCALVSEGEIAAALETADVRPLAVVPPATGLHTSYLVAGTMNSPTLHVLSLPSCRLVHTHHLQGVQVLNLAADRSGTSLAVGDRAEKAVHVLSWPLPGMPLL